MRYYLTNPQDIDRFRAKVENLIKNKKLCDLREVRPYRSLAQNNYLHLIISHFAIEYGCSAEQAKYDFFKLTANRDIFVRERINKRGAVVTFIRSSKDLDTAEMTLAVQRFRDWSSMQAGIYLPAPNEEQFLLYIREQIDINKDYI